MLALETGVVLALAPDILIRSIPSHGIFYAFNVSTGDHFRLNRTSYWILQSIGEGIEWTELETRFLGTFEVAQEEAQTDLRDIVNKFLKEEILRRAADGQAQSSL